MLILLLKIKPDKIDFSNIKGLQHLTEILELQKYTKINIDVFDVVGWANHYYTAIQRLVRVICLKNYAHPSSLKIIFIHGRERYRFQIY